ncbi:hypothetical protein [Alteromonas sp. CYL-A6]|uniref:hypothetical protein n=1 Tax=Alteromonas nitratireducens TaxID=3390813 RepID=UPI0034A91786
MIESDKFAHGYYRIQRKNTILVAEVKGGWNTDTAEAFCRDFKLEAAPLTRRNWSHLVYLAEWEMGVPGVDSIISDLVIWCIDNGLTHAAHINNEKAINQYYVNRIVSADGTVFEKKIFPNDEEGLAWLNSKGYSTSLTEGAHRANGTPPAPHKPTR